MRMLVLAFALAVLAFPVSAGAEADMGAPPACGDPDVSSLSIVDCEPVEALPSIDGSVVTSAEGVAAFAAAAAVVQELPDYCRLPAVVIFYTSTDWLRLAETMAADASPCAEYYFSIPAIADRKWEFRGPLQPELIRALGPRFHAMAEVHLGGWTTWLGAHPGQTWCDAGRAARAGMEEKNFRVSLGDAWSINEFSSAVRTGQGSARANAQEFVRCLYDGGDSSLPPRSGNVFMVGLGHGTGTTSVYKGVLRNWFADSAFWARMAVSVRWFGQEAYAAPGYTLVPETSRNERSRSVSDFLYAVANLAESGPDTIAVARDYLRASHYPLANAAWRYETGFGNTTVPIETMRQFVATEEYAVRHTVGSRPQTAQPFAGYAWSLRNVPAQPASIFNAETLALAQRLASSIRFTLAQGGNAPAGACGPPGEHIWCEGAWEGATFNSQWALLTAWDD